MNNMTPEEVAQAMELAPELAGIKPIRYLGIGAAGQQLVARLALHLNKALTILRAEFEILRKNSLRVENQCDAMEDKLTQAEARLAKAREDLRKYGRHTNPCHLAGLIAGDHGQYANCTCGLDAALKGEPT